MNSLADQFIAHVNARLRRDLHAPDVEREVADEITHLRAEVERLRAANAELTDALGDAVANLVAASSAYERHASRHRSVGRGLPDAFFTTRLKDMNAAFLRGREALSKHKEQTNG